MRVEQIDARCDRCGDVADRLVPYPHPITYYRRAIDKPWLCLNCLRIVKEKWWANRLKEPV